MSSISGVSSTANPCQITNQNSFGQTIQDFQAIGSALQSCNLSDAQNAFASLQTDLKAIQHKGRLHHHGSDATTTPATPATTSSGTDSDDDNGGSSLNVTA